MKSFIGKKDRVIDRASADKPFSADARTAVVVNDDPTQLDILAGLLRKGGLRARTFKTAEQALAAMGREPPPDLIVVDLYMPGIDGWRFCRLLRSPEYPAFNQVPLLVVSATFTGEEPDRIAADLGAEAFMSVPVDGAAFIAQTRAILKGRQVRNPLRVLIVEDDAVQAGMLKSAFQQHGFLADAVHTVAAAADAFHKNAYDTVAVDYHLPDGKGDALLDVFRNHRPDCVCIMMTTDPEPELALDWMKRGAAAYLRKPFEPEYLLELCARARRERTLLRVQDLLEIRTRELRESEKKHRDLSNMLRMLCDNVPDMIWAKDRESRFLFANRAFCDTILNTADTSEPVGKTDMFFTKREREAHPESPDWHTFGDNCGDSDAAVMAAAQPVQYSERGNVKGACLYMDVHKAPFFDQQGEIIGTVGSARDVTERKQAETALARKQAELKAVYDHAPVMMCVVDENRCIHYANPAFAVFSGLSEEDLKQGKACGVFGCVNAAEDPRGCGYGSGCQACALRTAIADTFETGCGHQGVEHNLSALKNGQRRDICVLAATTLLPTADTPRLLLCLHDITERKRAENAVRRRDALLEASEKIAHELLASTDLSAAMAHAVRIIGEASGQDRAYIFQVIEAPNTGDHLVSLRHEWVADGVTSEKNNPLFQNLPFAEAAPYCYALIRQGKIVCQPTREFPLEERKILEDMGVVSSLAVPVHAGKQWWGYIGFDNCRTEHEWDSAEKLVLANVAAAIGGAVARKRADEALRKSEARHRALLNAMPDMMFMFDADGVFRDYHATDTSTLLLDPAEFLGRRVHEVLPGSIADMTMTRIHEIAEFGAAAPYGYSAEVGGEIRHYESRMVACAEGNFLAIVRDVTARKRNDAARRLDEERLEALLRLNQMTDASLDEITHFALEEAVRLTGSAIGYVAFVNEDETVLTMHAWSRTAMEQCRLGDKPIVYPLEGTGLWGEAVRRRKAIVTNDYNADNPLKKGCPEGHVALRRHMNVPVFDGDRIVVVAGVGNKHDAYDDTDVRQLSLLMTGMWRIVQRKQVEKEREKLQAQLLQAQKMESVGRLAGGVAHDFNNMLGVILGRADMALEQTEPSGRLFADLAEIRLAAERSAGLTRQLLAFARKQTIAPKVLDLNETVVEMLKMLRRLIGENIELVWRPGGRLWTVKMDPVQIDQMLANLCVNARDAIAGVGRVAIETGVACFSEADCARLPGCVPGEYVLLAVSDDGRGMDPETAAKIFEPFFTTKAVGNGTGLGLATVYGIVKQNSGFIHVESAPGRGATFKIYLPRSDDAAEAKAKTAATPSPAVKSGGTVLLVEDETAILEMVGEMLGRIGYDVVSARTPGEAMRLMATHAGDIRLLVTDVVMPEMNGRELAETLRKGIPGLKCLFISGYPADVIARHGVIEKGVRFIQKPFTLRELRDRIREVVDA